MRIRTAKCRAENSTGGHRTWRRVILIWEWGRTPESALCQLNTSYTSAHSLLVNMTQTDCNRGVLMSLRPKASSWCLTGEIFQLRIQKMENAWLFFFFFYWKIYETENLCHLIVWCKLLLTGNHFYCSIRNPCIWLIFRWVLLKQKKKSFEIQKQMHFLSTVLPLGISFSFPLFPILFPPSKQGREIIVWIKLYSNSLGFTFTVGKTKKNCSQKKAKWILHVQIRSITKDQKFTLTVYRKCIKKKQ